MDGWNTCTFLSGPAYSQLCELLVSGSVLQAKSGSATRWWVGHPGCQLRWKTDWNQGVLHIPPLQDFFNLSIQRRLVHCKTEHEFPRSQRSISCNAASVGGRFWTSGFWAIQSVGAAMIVDLEDLKGNGCLICVEDYTMNYIPFFLRIFIRSHFFFGNHMEFLVEWIGDTLTLKDVSQLWIPKMFQTSPLSIQELVYSLARYDMSWYCWWFRNLARKPTGM